MSPSSVQAAPGDLDDSEFAELEELLAQTPEPLDPLTVVMLDGFLCGVLVQPVIVVEQDWLPYVFDLDAQPLPETVDAAWYQRSQELIGRRYQALNKALIEDQWFSPLVLELDPDATEPPPQPDASDEPDPMEGMGDIARALLPWVVGFQHALLSFPELSELPDDAVALALARIFRHLPAQTEEDKALLAMLERESPLENLDAATEELIAAVVDLADLTRPLRYKVDTVMREHPKLGRNDPCYCGSGKKYKQCHASLAPTD
jgi:uncharacterized protein